MQDLLLQHVPVSENQKDNPDNGVYNESINYINPVNQTNGINVNENSGYQTSVNQTNMINGKNSAIVQPMSTSVLTTENQNELSNSQSFPGLPYMYPTMPQNQRPITPPAMTYLVQSFMSNPVVSTFQNQLKPVSKDKKESPNKSSDEEFIDVVNDSLENPRNADTSKEVDTSLSTNSTSGSPSSGSNASSSPQSSATSTPKSTDSNKKKARTNYSPDQVQALEKVFHEQPYPDPEMMEKLSKDLDIQEGKIKVWFQNKRARWRRRAQETANNSAYQYPFMSPVMSPVAPFGFMPANPMFHGNSPPAQVMPGHLMYPSTPGSPSTQSSNQNQQSQQLTSPYQPRPGQFQPYFYTYPYGMYPPYYRG